MSGPLRPGRAPATLVLHALAFASGAAALVYEILWMRRFAVVLGATAPATAATLAALFTGLALGSWLFGRMSVRWHRPLLAFGLLELGIGAGAVVAAGLLVLADRVQPSLHAALAGHRGAMIAADTLVAVLAVLLPTTLMGGTLPALTQAASRHAGHLGVTAGGLYAVNTAGAATGALLVPAVLLPALGTAGSLAAGVLASACVGTLALLLARPAPPSDASGPEPAPPLRARRARATAPSVPPSRRALALMAFASGAIALGLEVLWTRMLALVHESSTHAFALVTAVFLASLAAGAGAGRTVARRRPAAARRVLVAAWVLSGLCAVATPRAFVALTDLRQVGSGSTWAADQVALALTAAAVLLPATVLAGMVLPLLMEMAGGQGGESGPVVGRLLAANLAGCVAGPFVATFALLPTVGLWGAISFAAALSVAAGALSRDPGGPPTPRRIAAGLAPVMLVLAAGAILRPWTLPVASVGAGERVIAVHEGAMGTVAVIGSGDTADSASYRMKLDNMYTIGGTLSAGDERMQAHVPLLLHPAPRRVAFLGLGTGITAGAAMLHDVEQVEAVEIVPEVVTAARTAFAQANLGVADDPRVTIVHDDARTWLRSAGARFDVIAGDLFVPWRRGEARLYSLEQFEAARGALAPGGVFCQWVPMYQVSEEDFRGIAATFLHVFPSATLWRGDFRAVEPALALVAFRDGEALDPAAVDARAAALARRRDDANPYMSHPAGVWLHLVGPLAAGDPWLLGAPLNRDAAPWIELRSSVGRAGAARRRDAAFVAGDLDALLERVAAAPLAGTPLERAAPEHLRWRDAGAALWRASLLAHEGRLREADRLGFATIATLPEPIQLAVTGGAPLAP
jgi:spermidine synthase